MKIKQSAGERVFDTFNTAFMIVCMAVALYPFLHVLFASISDPVAMVQHRGLLLWPEGFNPESYFKVFENPMIVIGYGNTLVYLVAGTSLNILLTSFGAYALSRKNVFFRDYVMFGIAFTMLFSGGLIPTYLLVRGLGILDTRWAIILPSAISAWNLIIMRTSFQAIPDSLEESAKIDGANDFTVLFKIILPLSLPVVSVMILFYGVYHWNSWFNAMIYLRSRELYPLQLILREILIANNTDNMTTQVSDFDKQAVGESVKYATVIVATLPILIAYPVLQKYFVKGVMVGAVKG